MSNFSPPQGSSVPSDVARTDAQQYWTQKQTFGSGVGMASSDVTGALGYTPTQPTVALANSADVNTVTVSGFYRLGSTPVNAPSGVDYGQLIVSRGSDTIMQIVTGFNDNEYYMRQANGIGGTPSWQPWRKLWHDGNAPTIVTSVNGNSGSVTVQGGSSASGTWTPSAGTFNVAVGAVISIASVPSGATVFTGYHYGTNSGSAFWGSSSASVTQMSFGNNSGGASVYSSAANKSATTYLNGDTYYTNVYDGSYTAGGYFQLNGGYLQFVVTHAGTTSNYAQETLQWGIS